MPRSDRVLAGCACALAGCMTIYPDPELPDVEVYLDARCADAPAVISLALVGLDDPAFRSELVVPCSDDKVTLADVPRQRFRLETELRSAAGEVLAVESQELDVRNGFDLETYVEFLDLLNVEVGWTFVAGASCESLGADQVYVEFSTAEAGAVFAAIEPCAAGSQRSQLEPGQYTVVARALANLTTVAISPPSPPVEVDFGSLADAGVLVLEPCGATCP